MVLLSDFLDKLEGVKKCGTGFSARCPAHEDGHASLTIGNGEKGIVLDCKAGCTASEVVAAMKLELHDLFPATEPANATITASYAYVNETGLLLFEKRRYYPKTFRLRRPDGVCWVDSIDGVRRVLYRLTDICSRPSDPAWICEGEKDADRLACAGLVATTNFEGGGGWKPEYADALAGRPCVILEDNDDVGRKRTLTVGLSLMGKVPSIKLISFPGTAEHYDVSDWLDAGHTAADLVERAEAAPQWTPPVTEDAAPLLDTVRPFDMTPTAPQWLVDGILARQKRLIIGGEPKAGKSLLALQMGICMALGARFMDQWETRPSTTLILSTEGGAPFASARVQQLCWGMHLTGIERDRVNTQIRIINRSRIDLTDKDGVAALRRTLHTLKPDTLVLDPLADLMSGDENEAEAMKTPCHVISDLLDELPQLAVVVVHHVNKAAKDKSIGYSLRGSSYLSGWYDSLLVARKLDPDLPRRLDGEHRYAADPMPLGYRILGGEGDVPGLPSLMLSACDAPKRVAVGRPLDVADLDRVVSIVKRYTGEITRGQAAQMLGMDRTKFNRYYDNLATIGQVASCGKGDHVAVAEAIPTHVT